jgi:hypothetical protein
MRLTALLFVFMLLTTGCAKVVKDFVDNAPDPVTPVVPPPPGAEDDGAFKLSPGMVRSQGSNISMKATITPTTQTMTGTNMSAVLGLHKSR